MQCAEQPAHIKLEHWTIGKTNPLQSNLKCPGEPSTRAIHNCTTHTTQYCSCYDYLPAVCCKNRDSVPVPIPRPMAYFVPWCRIWGIVAVSLAGFFMLSVSIPWSFMSVGLEHTDILVLESSQSNSHEAVFGQDQASCCLHKCTTTQTLRGNCQRQC